MNSLLFMTHYGIFIQDSLKPALACIDGSCDRFTVESMTEFRIAMNVSGRIANQ